MFDSVAQVEERLRDQGYICDRKIATVVFLAHKLEKPVLVEGPAGVGKTELAKVVAAATGRNLIRLQCYEGLDEAKALYEWEYSKQLLYTQILKERFSDVMQGAKTLRDAAERVGLTLRNNERRRERRVRRTNPSPIFRPQSTPRTRMRMKRKAKYHCSVSRTWVLDGD